MRQPLIHQGLVVGISITAVVLLTLTSLSNVIGYQTIQTSNQSVIKERINQRELLFQTIVDIANNKEIQRIILKSQMSRGISPTSEFPIVTKNQLKMMYFLGLILSKVVSKSKLLPLVEQYQIRFSDLQKKLTTVIEKEPGLNEEISQLSNLIRQRDNEDYPILNLIFFFLYVVLCGILGIIVLVSGVIFALSFGFISLVSAIKEYLDILIVGKILALFAVVSAIISLSVLVIAVYFLWILINGGLYQLTN